jgi:hypothetical protein
MGHPAIGEETDRLSPDVGHRLGMAGLLSKIEKPAGMGRLFLFFYYKFSISGWRG